MELLFISASPTSHSGATVASPGITCGIIYEFRLELADLLPTNHGPTRTPQYAQRDGTISTHVASVILNLNKYCATRLGDQLTLREQKSPKVQRQVVAPYIVILRKDYRPRHFLN